MRLYVLLKIELLARAFAREGTDMSEVNNVKRYGRYAVAALALLLAVVLIARTPVAVTQTNSFAGKPAGPGAQANMPGGAAAPVSVSNPSSAESGQGSASPQGVPVVGHSIKNDVSP